MKKSTAMFLTLAALFAFCGCDAPSTPPVVPNDAQRQQAVQAHLSHAQPTPTDVRFSLERYNLRRRAYWVNGMREKALALPCPIDRPLGYVVLFAGNTVAGRFVVDGKVSSLRNYLTPESEYYGANLGVSGEFGRTVETFNKWLADTDGCFGDNDSGVFFFTPAGNYIEWGGEGRT